MQSLANQELDKSYNPKQAQMAEQLSRSPIGIQLTTDGWKRKGVNSDNKMLNFIATLPDGGREFLKVTDTEGSSMAAEQTRDLIDAQVVDVAGKLQDEDKILGVISDGEAAVRKALRYLEERYPLQVNMADRSGESAGVLDHSSSDILHLLFGRLLMPLLYLLFISTLCRHIASTCCSRTCGST